MRRIDPNFEWRQLSLVTAAGQVWARTGDTCYPYAGHITGADWVASGNVLTGPSVVEAMGLAMESGRDLDLAERLLRALEAGRAAGGQGDSDAGTSLPELSSVLYVVDGRSPMPTVDLRVDHHRSAIEALRSVYDHVKSLDWYFPVMWDRPWDLIDEAHVVHSLLLRTRNTGRRRRRRVANAAESLAQTMCWWAPTPNRGSSTRRLPRHDCHYDQFRRGKPNARQELRAQ